MKLFYKQGACSLATHIILREAGVAFDLELVDTDTGVTASGLDYREINPKGYVPALQLASGEVLTEGAAVLQYVADQYGNGELVPEAGSLSRVRVQEYLNYVSAELHKSFAAFFTATATAEDKHNAELSLAKKFAYLNSLFADGREYLVADRFSIADAYLFVVSNWANFVGIDLQRWPEVAAFVSRITARPAVQAALREEGLV